MQVEIEEVYAIDENELKEKLNALNALHIISVHRKYDHIYEIIYEK